MARLTNAELQRLLTEKAERCAMLEGKLSQALADNARLKNAIATVGVAKAGKPEEGGTCVRCEGSGQVGPGECFRCQGTGIDPGVEEGRRRFAASRRAAQRPASEHRVACDVMREAAKDYCAEHGVSSCTPDQVRAWLGH